MFCAGEHEYLMPAAFANNVAENIALVRLVDNMNSLVNALSRRVACCDRHFACVM